MYPQLRPLSCAIAREVVFNMEEGPKGAYLNFDVPSGEGIKVNCVGLFDSTAA